ncbi:MAG: bifunctional metallophosphatase/5'-nucleotidase, partial [Streptosporangiales bacterium]|nr:bifunctional metallophosphatase/5'-nucleotidase [Streptosporangiales bacterium]
MSRLLRRFAIVGTAVAVTAAGFAGAGAATAAAGARTVPIQLLGINDLHGNLEPPTGSSGRVIDETGATVDAGGAAYLAAHLKRLRAANSIRVAAGDSIGATPLLSAAYHDEPTIELLNHVGLNTSSVGNHEFDEGYTELQRIQQGGCHPVDGCAPGMEYDGADFPFLAANVIRESDDRTAFPASVVKHVGGARIGFIGVVTKTTPSIVTADGVKGLKFLDEVESADKAARDLRKRGVKAIVLVVHEGDQVTAGATPDSCQVVAGGPGTRIAGQVTPDVDVVMTGHSHQPYNCTMKDPAGNSRVVMQGGSF